MSTNKPHPLASTPILEYPCHMEWWEYQLVVSIFGDHGLLSYSDRPGICGNDRLAIWNWCTGDLLAAMHTQDEVLNSSLFLSEDVFLPSIGIAPLKIMTYPCTLTPPPFIPIPTLLCKPHYNPPPYAPQTIALFSLPALQTGLGYVYILARSRQTYMTAPSY